MWGKLPGGVAATGCHSLGRRFSFGYPLLGFLPYTMHYVKLMKRFQHTGVGLPKHVWKATGVGAA